MIRAFIFDIGNVLLRFDFAHAFARLEGRCDLPAEALLQAWEPIKIAHEHGEMTRVEFQQRVMEAIRFAGTEREFVTAWEEIFEENLPMTALVANLHEHYPLYLLSNTSDLHVDYIFRTYSVFRLFRDAVYSFRARSMKPDTQIFKIAIAQFGIEPAETVYVDDLKPNVETALHLGFRAFQYDPGRHEEFLAFLEREGVSTARRKTASP